MGRFSGSAPAQRQRIHGQPSVSRVHRTRTENPRVPNHVRDRAVLRRYGQIEYVLHDVANSSRPDRHVLQQRPK